MNKRRDPATRFWPRVKKTKTCWVWTGGKHTTGYGCFWDGVKDIQAHHFLTPPPPGLLVLHRCDNRLCVNPDHIFFGTHKDNMQDCKAKGRMEFAYGEKQWNSKLKPQQVVEIIESKGGRELTAKLAKRFGVGKMQIWSIRTGKSWRHIPRKAA